MPLTARVQSLNRDIALLVEASLSPQAQARAFAAAAHDIIARVDADNDRAAGRDVSFETFVDGRRDDALASVTIRSTIVAAWDVGHSVLAEIRDMLRATAPVRSGRYRDTLLMLADGQPADPDAPPQASEYAFVSPQPYARKIERGQGRYAPAARMESAAALAQRRFGNIARVRFGYRSLQGGALGQWAAKTTLRSRNGQTRNRPGDKRSEWLTRQPAVIVTMR